MSETDRSDAQRLEAWRRGDRRAAEQLIADYGPRLYNFFAGKVSRDADLLCHQVLSDCVASGEPVQPQGQGGSVRALLFGAARRRLIERLERGGGPVDPLVRSVADLESGVSEVLAPREQQRRLVVALRGIPVDEQIALELHYWEQLSPDEIAAVLQAPVGSIDKTLTQARRRLQQQLEVERAQREQTVDARGSEERSG